jgi:hypothetical protein
MAKADDINPPLDAAVIEHLRAEKITVFTVMLTGDKISEPSSTSPAPRAAKSLMPSLPRRWPASSRASMR